jgi:hypothetical protein
MSPQGLYLEVWNVEKGSDPNKDPIKTRMIALTNPSLTSKASFQVNGF